MGDIKSNFKLFIAGQWVEGGNGHTQDVINPATEKVIGRLCLANELDLERALTSAEKGLSDWKAVPPWTRGTIMKDAAHLVRSRSKDIAQLMTREHGKTLVESDIEITRAADFIEWGGEEARRISSRAFAARELDASVIIDYGPVGVIAAFAPWNYPVLQPSKKLAAILAAGCSCVLKPAEETPASTNALLQCLLDAGLPDHVVNLVYGIPSEISSFLISDRRIAKITFTGSVPVGKILAAEAGKYMIPSTMELGGHSPVLVYPDTDLHCVTDILVARKFANSAQVCVSPNRFFIHEDIIDEFTTMFCKKASALTIGEGTDPEVQMGPLANQRRLDSVEHLVSDALHRGADLVLGGTRLNRRGYFFPPTVLRNVAPESDLMTVEPFGPVVPINGFSDDEDVLRRANDCDYGLAGYIFTDNEKRQRYLASNLEVGTIGINDIPSHTADIPLGGWKDSGIGVEGGIEMTQAYLRSQFRYVKAQI